MQGYVSIKYRLVLYQRCLVFVQARLHSPSSSLRVFQGCYGEDTYIGTVQPAPHGVQVADQPGRGAIAHYYAIIYSVLRTKETTTLPDPRLNYIDYSGIVCMYVCMDYITVLRMYCMSYATRLQLASIIDVPSSHTPYAGQT